jgi:hypothetical protein
MCRGQQALPAPQAQAAQLLAGAGQNQEVCRGQQALPAPQAQAAQLLAGAGLDVEDGGQQLQCHRHCSKRRRRLWLGP